MSGVFNCAHTGTPLKRNREEILLDGECSEGNFVMWRVLGFGGKPNPLVFSRVRKHPTRRRVKDTFLKAVACLPCPLLASAVCPR